MKNDFNSGNASIETRLDSLEPGSTAEVVSVDTADATGRRLQDLGLLPGTRILALNRAPLGDPGLYELRGYRLCLRGADARRVRVRLRVDPGDRSERSATASTDAVAGRSTDGTSGRTIGAASPQGNR